MTAEHFRSMSREDRDKYHMACAMRDNIGALMELQAFEEYLDKKVKVVKGRKVPIGTVGTVFWVGMQNYSRYGNWWSWKVRLGFKTEAGETFFTNEVNVELLPEAAA